MSLNDLTKPLGMYSSCDTVINRSKKFDNSIIDEVKASTVIVTGANSGVGLGTAKAFAKLGCHVIMACRSSKKAEEAIKEIEDSLEESDSCKLQFIKLDLNSLESVATFSEEVMSLIEAKKIPKLKVIVMNAGIIPFQFQRTTEGVEQGFGVNHLGHFFLLKQIAKDKKLVSNGSLRIVVVSSHNHYASIPCKDSELSSRDTYLEKFAQLSTKGKESKGFGTWSAYGGSKLANVYFSRSINGMEMNGVQITAASCNPGIVHTNVGNNFWLFRILMPYLGPLLLKNVDQGASTSVLCSLLPDEMLTESLYFNANKAVKPSKRVLGAKGKECGDVLWKVSEELCDLFLKGKPLQSAL